MVPMTPVATIDIIIDPSCSRNTYLDMALGSTLGLNITMPLVAAQAIEITMVATRSLTPVWSQVAVQTPAIHTVLGSKRRHKTFTQTLAAAGPWI